MQMTKPTSVNVTNAAVGILQRPDGSVLLGQRPHGKSWAGYWEFPGGKLEAHEQPAQALVRELQEELGILAITYYPWLTRTYDYPARYHADGRVDSPANTVKLHFFIVTAWQGEPQGIEGQPLIWQNPKALQVSPMLPANAPIMAALDLPPVYALTNVHELGLALFFERLSLALTHGLGMIQVREKYMSNQAFAEFAAQVITRAEAYQAKVIINADIELARTLKAAGVHFTSAQLLQLRSRPEGLICGAACHNQAELAHAAALGMDYVTLSPVMPTDSHPDAKTLGWQVFREWVQAYPLPVYALGGMQLTDVPIARSCGAHGVAMQRAAW